MTKAEYIAMSAALQNAIPLMPMVRKLKEKFDIDIYCDAAEVFCWSFKENSSVLEHARLACLRPCAKYINIW